MSPKKAIIIVLILAVIIGVIFTTIYVIKTRQQAKLPSGGISQTATSSEVLTPPQKIEQAVQQTIQQTRQENKGKINQTTERQATIDTINEAIMQIEQAKTPEQIAQEKKDQEARQKTIDQINSQVNNAKK